MNQIIIFLSIILGLSCFSLGGEFELQPTGQNKLVAIMDLSLSKRISIGCRLAKFTTTKKYTVQIYDSSDCKNLKTKLTLYAFDTKTGTRRAINPDGSALLVLEANAGFPDTGSYSVTGEDEILETKISSKAFTLEDASSKEVLACGISP